MSSFSDFSACGNRLKRRMAHVAAEEKCHFFQKKMPDSFGSFKKTTTFALAIGKNDERLQK